MMSSLAIPVSSQDRHIVMTTVTLLRRLLCTFHAQICVCKARDDLIMPVSLNVFIFVMIVSHKVTPVSIVTLSSWAVPHPYYSLNCIAEMVTRRNYMYE